MSSVFRTLFQCILILMFGASAFAVAQFRGGTPNVVINETDADMSGDETTEFIELYDGGAGNTSLTGMVVVLFNGSDDASYEPVFDLDGLSTDANGFFLIGGSGIPGIDKRVAANTAIKVDTLFWLQNGADAVALFTGDATDFPNDTAVTTTNLIDAIVYDTGDNDDAALLALLNAGQPQVDERGGGDGNLHANARVPDGGTARNTMTYIQQAPTPGTSNGAGPVPDIFINELDADMSGDEDTEFVELYDGGTGNTALDGLSVILYNGSDDASYLPSFDLDGLTTDANGFFLIGGAGIAGIDDRVTAGTGIKVDTLFWLQNGADAVAVILGDAADFPEDTPVSTDNLIDAVVYDTADNDDAGLLVLLNAGQPQVDERGGGDGNAHSNARLPDGGTLRNTDTYVQQAPTPGITNVIPDPVVVVINETDADMSGDEDTEFIELYDGGVGNAPLDGMSVILYNGSDDASYLPTFDLDGLTTDANGFFVIGGTGIPGIDDRVTAGTGIRVDSLFWLQNGADAVALITGDAIDFPEDTPVSADNVLDAIVYDTGDNDDAALLVLLNAGQPQVDERGGGNGDAHSNARLPDGGTPRNTDTYVQQEPTPGASNAGAGIPTIFINEVDTDMAGDETTEFVELYDGGTGNTALDGLVVVLFNGSDDSSYEPAFDLDGLTTDANGFFLIGGTGIAGIDDRVAANTGIRVDNPFWLQNGADAVAILQGDAVDFPNDTAITTDNLIDGMVYDTNDNDDAALLVLLNAGQPQINEDGLGLKDTQSSARVPDGGTLRNTDTYVNQEPTPGASNVLPDPVVVVINETDADTPGTDMLEFIELYDGGAGNTALDGLSVVLYNGSDDASYEPAFDLDGLTTDADGFFLIASTAVPGIADRVTAGTGILAPDSNWLQNGADAVALITGDAANFPTDTPISADNVVDAIVYDTADSDDAGLLILLNAGQPQVDERGGGDGAAHSNSRLPDGGTARNTDTYVQQDPTPGFSNVPAPTIQLVLNEFLADPAGDLSGDANGDGVRDSSDDEFVELINTSGADLDVSDWTIADSSQTRHVFPAGTVIPNQTAIVVFGGGTPTGEFGGAIVQTATTGAIGLNNGGDSIIVQNGLAEEVLNVAYGSEAGNNQSRTLDPDVTGAAYADHSTVANSGGALFSPGTRTDGSPFLGGGTDSDPIVIDCGENVTILEGLGGEAAVTATDPDSIITDITIENITPAPTAGSITAVFAAATKGVPATATVTVTDDVPSGRYEVLMLATNDDTVPQLAGCVLVIDIVAGLPIGEIQGDGLVSPVENQTVSTSGVVTVVGPDAFAIQDVTGDGNPNTSDGIFVFTDTAPTVSVGDEVAILADVEEFFGFTRLVNIRDLGVLSTGNALPSPIPFDENTPSSEVPQSEIELEQYESMLVRVTNAMINGGNQGFGSDPIAEVFINAGGTRVFREPGILFPGQAKLPVWDGNPEMIELDPNRLGLENVTLTGGSRVTATGILGFEFGGYELFPAEMTVDEVTYPRAVRERQPGEFTVGTQNMLRLFDDIPDPVTDGIRAEDGPVAVGTDEYNMRLGKFSMAIRDVLGAPDILALQEVENIGVLDALAARIAADDPSINYTSHLIEGNDIGGIDVGFLTRDSITVDSVTQIQPDEMFTFDGSEFTLHDRPPLLLEGSYNGGAVPFPISVIAIHNRSLIDVDSSEFVQTKRHQQALRISQAVQELQVANPDIQLMLLGDFNAFEFTDGFVDSMGQITGNPDPLGALIPATDEVNPDLTNHTFSVPAEDRYSFMQNESLQVLDHILTSQALTCKVAEVQFSRYVVDVAEIFEDDANTPLRATDHEGAVAFITTPGITVAGSSLSTTEAGGTDTVTVVLDSQPNADVTIALSSSDDTEGTVSPAALTFTSANWDTPQTVTLTGVNDDIADGDIAYELVFAAAESTNTCYAGLTLDPIAATNSDDDAVGIAVAPVSGLITSETGDSDTFTVVLESEPVADVTIPLSVDDATEGSLDQSELIFSAANWNTPQTVTVTGVDDDVVDGDVIYHVLVEAAVSSDPAYAGLDAADVEATNFSKDIAGFIQDGPTSNITDENGASTSFTLVLQSEPVADVTVPVAVSDSTEAMVDASTLTFTAANWNTPQTVNIIGLADGIIDGDQSYTVSWGPSTSSDADYNAVSGQPIAMTNLDLNSESDYLLQAIPGQALVVTGPDGVVGIYSFDQDTGEWTFLGNVTITDGVGVSDIITEQDGSYGIGAPDNGGAPTTAVVAIPTLGEWGLILFVMLLLSAAVFQSRRQRLA